MSERECILLLRLTQGGVRAELAYRTSLQVDPIRLASDIPVRLNAAVLRESLLDPDEYGRRLTEMVFADRRLQVAWARVRGTSSTGRLHLRLDIAPHPVLQCLFWETLHDPLNPQQPALCQHQDLLLSRTANSAEVAVPPSISAKQLRALVVLSSPINLPANLHPIDAAAELARVEKALGPIPLTAIGRLVSDKPASISELAAHLRGGYQIVYLLCHGRIDQMGSIMLLEDEHGAIQQVRGGQVAQIVGGLEGSRLPLLMLLGACNSVGSPPDSYVAAGLGPLLAQAGVAAVVGMLGRVPVSLVDGFVPALFSRLSEHGRIDRAVAEARAALDAREEWWRPVLYTRLPYGRLWVPPQQQSGERPVRGTTPRGLQRTVHSNVKVLELQVRNTRSWGEKLHVYKQLHDQLHEIYYEHHVIEHEIVPDFPARRGSLFHHVRQLEKRVDKLLTVAVGEAQREQNWVAELGVAVAALQRAAEASNVEALDLGRDQIRHVLNIQLPAVNKEIKRASEAMGLAELAERGGLLRPLLHDKTPIRNWVGRFLDTIDTLQQLQPELVGLVHDHDEWQDIHSRLLMLSIAFSLPSLRSCWRNVAPKTRKLFERSSGEPLDRLGAALNALDSALGLRSDASSHDHEALVSTFEVYRGEANFCFYKVDTRLRKLCERFRGGVVELDEAMQQIVSSYDTGR